MMNLKKSITGLLLLSSIVWSNHALGGDPIATNPPTQSAFAINKFKAELVGSSGKVIGEVIAQTAPVGMLLQIRATALPPGSHAVHVHAVGDCSDLEVFERAGAHIGHENHAHSHKDGAKVLRGDLPNVYAHSDGTAHADYFAYQLTARDFEDADGAALIVHTNPDNYWIEPTGGAGARIACANFEPCDGNAECQWKNVTNNASADFPASLFTETPKEGFALAIKLSRLAVKAAQPDVEVLKKLRPIYSTNADSLIASSQVVAVHFRTIAIANNHWRPNSSDDRQTSSAASEASLPADWR